MPPPASRSFWRASRLVDLTAVLLLAVALAGCARDEASMPTLAEVRAEQGPEQESWGAVFRISDEGIRRVHLSAGYMARYERGDSTYLDLYTEAPATSASGPDSLANGGYGPGRVTAYLFDEAGDSSAVLTADRARYYEDDRLFEAEGQVVVTTTTGRRLETERLRWREDEQQVETDGFVRITTPTEQIQGYDLTADEDLETYTLLRVTGRVVRTE